MLDCSPVLPLGTSGLARTMAMVMVTMRRMENRPSTNRRPDQRPHSACTRLVPYCPSPGK